MYNDLVLYSDFHRYYGSTLAVEEGREKSMAEIKVGENESLDNALKGLKGNVPVLVFFPNTEKENIMKNQV